MTPLILALIWTFAAVMWIVAAVFQFRAGNKWLGILNSAVAVINFVPAVIWYGLT